MIDITHENTSIYEYVYEIQTPPGWEEFFNKLETKKEIAQISEKLDLEPDKKIIYPNVPYVFYALFLVPPEQIKVLIIGQDPYHGPNQAMGLAFSVQKGQKIPPSLQNIFKELGIRPDHGSLVSWAKQGVLLINATCTVLRAKPNCHNDMWDNFTRLLIQYIRNKPKVALLWGSFAINIGKDLICEKICTTHPSPMSAYNNNTKYPAFIGSKCFEKANEILEKNGLSQIDWFIKNKK